MKNLCLKYYFCFILPQTSICMSYFPRSAKYSLLMEKSPPAMIGVLKTIKQHLSIIHRMKSYPLKIKIFYSLISTTFTFHPVPKTFLFFFNDLKIFSFFLSPFSDKCSPRVVALYTPLIVSPSFILWIRKKTY